MGAGTTTPGFYFGCWTYGGHHLRGTNGRSLGYTNDPSLVAIGFPWAGGGIDGKLTPRASRKQGAAALHHLDGWTALAWHDYSVDSRGGSNSVVFLPGTLTFEAATEEGRRLFPHVFERQPSPIAIPFP
jgi:hypothetical protein